MWEREQLEDHLRHHPEDWSSWLVYADYLLEQGDMRGRLITLSHRLENATLSDGERRELQEEVDALTDEHREEWQSGIESMGAMAYEWRFGFIVGVKISRSLWQPLTLAEEHAIEDALSELCEHPSALFLTALDLSVEDFDEASALVSAEWVRDLCCTLPSLTALNLSNNRIGDDGVKALTTSDALRSLTTLDLSGNEIVDGVQTLADSDVLCSLTTLNLSNNRIGHGGVEALADSDVLCSLTTLNLSQNRLSDDEVEVLATSETLRSLTTLDLSENHLCSLKSLANSDNLRSLVTLNLSCSSYHLDDHDALKLAASNTLRSLTTLDLSYNYISDEGRAALEQSETLRHCKVLT